jgi:hypothetical protein
MTADPNPHAIALVGDIHGKPAAFEHTLATALNRGVTSIVQVGDFWIYDAPKEPAKLERIIARVCRDANVDADLVDYRFIDGNHESFDYLTPDIADPVRISEHVTYMPRGTRAKLADAELLFFGGASSADKQYRTEGKTRWPAENITDDQLARGLAAARTRPVDVLVTHETTTAVFADLCAPGRSRPRQSGRSTRGHQPGEAGPTGGSRASPGTGPRTPSHPPCQHPRRRPGHLAVPGDQCRLRRNPRHRLVDLARALGQARHR